MPILAPANYLVLLNSGPGQDPEDPEGRSQPGTGLPKAKNYKPKNVSPTPIP